ncbi:hypothetical protein AXK11_03395 [Cephaloticoccus primus]|uniref:DUF192 domain-containing protein n=1 Tax=Cephaloticoccus primus TaxID=1548207 RepID=A0A139SQZ3_9BACT|nr:hypothetical protein AXK11_03395 [Cephaloticoccus primus]
MLSVIWGGCNGSESGAGVAAPKTASDWFTISVGEHPLRLQLAVTPSEMQRGLMERRELGADEGMLFVYLRPDQVSFWMRNTPLPLDIGFFDAEGVLREVYPLHPFDERPVTSRSRRLQFALEVNRGWFKAHGLGPGAQLDLQALTTALHERDFPLKQFGLGDGNDAAAK